MKSILILAGAGLIGYGIYLNYKRKQPIAPCGKTNNKIEDKSLLVAVVPPEKPIGTLVPDNMLESFDVSNSVAPARTTISPLPVGAGMADYPIDILNSYTISNC